MRRFRPLPEDHPSVGEVCPVCEEPFKAGDETTLVATTPASMEDAEKARQGKAYNSQAAVVHWICRPVL